MLERRFHHKEACPLAKLSTKDGLTQKTSSKDIADSVWAASKARSHTHELIHLPGSTNTALNTPTFWFICSEGRTPWLGSGNLVYESPAGWSYLLWTYSSTQPKKTPDIKSTKLLRFLVLQPHCKMSPCMGREFPITRLVGLAEKTPRTRYQNNHPGISLLSSKATSSWKLSLSL